MIQRVNAKSTKAEIIAAYDELKKEKSALESEVKRLNKETKIATLTTANNPVNKDNNNQKMTQSNNLQNNIDLMIIGLEKLQIGFGSAVSNLSEQLITEASSLAELQESVTEEIQALNDLHELEEIEENTLENLISSYQENAKNFDEELSQQQEILGQQIEDLKKAWQKEKDHYWREVQERNENYQKTKARDIKEYQYNLEQERYLSIDEYEQNKQNLYKELEEARQEQEKQWQQREENLVDQEKQYAETKEKVAAFEKELEENIKRGKDNGRNIGYAQARITFDLRTKEVDGEKKNYELRIGSLEEIIENNQNRITSLSQQLSAALKQVQDLAVKAIEGTSNRQSFESIKEIAMEQAKTQNKNK